MNILVVLVVDRYKISSSYFLFFRFLYTTHKTNQKTPIFCNRPNYLEKLEVIIYVKGVYI